MVVTDEIEVLRELAPLEGARLLELGCGKAELARRLATQAPIASIIALEVDAIQHERNVASAPPAKLEFRFGGAQDIPLPDASADGVLMMKSLHHVPMALLDQALLEVRRVLKPGGWLYVSEPVYAGPFNDILRLFHDEGVVRAAARRALQRATQAGVLQSVAEREFLTPRTFRDYDDFVAKVVRVTHTDHGYPDSVAREVRARFDKFQTPDGARFLQPTWVSLLRSPAAP